MFAGCQIFLAYVSPVVQQKQRGHVVWVRGVARDSEACPDDGIQCLLVSRQEAPFVRVAVVSLVAFDVFLQARRGIVCGIQGEAEQADIGFVPVSPIRPEQLLGELRQVRRGGCIGGHAGDQPEGAGEGVPVHLSTFLVEQIELGQPARALRR